MKTKGIRILDKENGVIIVELYDILKEIQNGNLLHWSIIFLDASGDLGKGKSIPLFCQQINESENGLFIKWDELNSLSKKISQTIDIILIGSHIEEFLHHYSNDQEMYESCDIVIEMVDSSFWEVFSKNEDLINRLKAKFKNIELLDSDYKTKFYK